MTRPGLALATVAVACALLVPGARAMRAALRVDVLRPVAALPPHVTGLFEEPIGFQRPPGGPYYVFDRRAHAVYTIDADRVTSRKLVEIGPEMGRIIQPRGFDVSPTGDFVIADAPRGQERIQIFGPAGLRTNGFFLPGRVTSSITVGNLVLNGVASLQLTSRGTLLMSEPETGALFTEYSRAGTPLRGIGVLRETGFEQDRPLHMALNAGLPLVDPAGGFYYVFLAGRPMFRKYDATGTLVYERHIEGTELDSWVAALPNRWPTRRVEDREIPYVAPTVRAAAVDAQSRLWIAFSVPYTYVYDASGDKVRTVQFSSTGVFLPSSLAFAGNGRLLVTPGCYEFDPDA